MPIRINPEAVPFPFPELPPEHSHVLGDVGREVERAAKKFAPFNSPHEGWAVIKEELDELWEHVRDDTGRSQQARTEAIQIAAMAVRYAADLTETPYTGRRLHDEDSRLDPGMAREQAAG
jgi:hypothetical protein